MAFDDDRATWLIVVDGGRYGPAGPANGSLLAGVLVTVDAADPRRVLGMRIEVRDRETGPSRAAARLVAGLMGPMTVAVISRAARRTGEVTAFVPGSVLDRHARTGLLCLLLDELRRSGGAPSSWAWTEAALLAGAVGLTGTPELRRRALSCVAAAGEEALVEGVPAPFRPRAARRLEQLAALAWRQAVDDYTREIDGRAATRSRPRELLSVRVTLRPAPSSAFLHAVQEPPRSGRALDAGRAAARCERIGDWSGAAMSWQDCARAWSEAGRPELEALALKRAGLDVRRTGPPAATAAARLERRAHQLADHLREPWLFALLATLRADAVGAYDIDVFES